MTDSNAGTTGPRVKWRVFHWTIAIAFLTMLVTGIIIYTPAFSGLASGAWTRLFHRIGAAVLIGAPILYAFVNPKAARQWLREAALWNRKAADTPHVLNTWKRRHKLLISVGYVLFAITGLIQWFAIGVNLKDCSSAINIRPVQHYPPVKAARPEKGWVKYIRTVGSS